MVETINKNDLEGIINQTQNTGLQRTKNRVEVMIHTMPKRFLQLPDQSSKKNKNIGLYIVLGGSFVLLVVLALLYYYLLRTSEPQSLINENRTIAIQDSSTTTSVSKADKEPKTNKQTPPAKVINENNSQVEEIIDEKSLVKEEGEKTTTIINNEKIDIAKATNTIETIPTEPEIITEIVLKVAVDTDGDGLSDIEEVALDCNPQTKDSDGDGYDDLAELVKLYNPAGGGKIIVNPNIEKYINSEFNYSMYYPKNWIINNTLGNNSVVFQLGGDEFIQIMLEPKFTQASLDDWYKEQFKVSFIEPSKKIFKAGWAGIKNDDGLIVYLYNPNYDYLVILSYNPGNNTIKYQNLFEMMINSLDFIN